MVLSKIKRFLVLVMLLRRDVMEEDWSDPISNKYGLKATTRFCIGILRSTAAQKPLCRRFLGELVYSHREEC
jgi:hypothetical protein